MDGGGQCLIWPCDYTPLSKRAFSIPSHYTASLVFRIWSRISNDPFGRCYGLCDEFVVHNRRFLEILTKKKRIYDILRVDFYSTIDL